MTAHDILKQKILDTEEGHTTGITRDEEEAQTTLENCYQVHRAITKDQPTSGA